MKDKNSVYEIITNQIIEALEQGNVPWKKPWVHNSSLPQNFLSKRPYSGINFFLLSLSQFESPYWMTFKQIKDKKGSLKKGSKGTPIAFYKMLEKKDKTSGVVKNIPLLRYYRVFNADQVEGIDFPEIQTENLNENFSNIEKAEEILKACESKTCKIQYRNQGSAYFKPLSNEIILPERKQFKSSEEFYSTAFHELIHASGNPLERDMKGLFGDHLYSKEELIAEMGSSFLCAFAGIAPQTIENQTAYIQSWLKKLKNDPKFVIEAASKAQKAVGFLLEGSLLAEEKEVA